MSAVEQIFVSPPISPLDEMGAYEALWSFPGTTFKTLADMFRSRPGGKPSELVDKQNIREFLGSL